MTIISDVYAREVLDSRGIQRLRLKYIWRMAHPEVQ